jgi:hypothetical protein
MKHPTDPCTLLVLHHGGHKELLCRDTRSKCEQVADRLDSRPHGGILVIETNMVPFEYGLLEYGLNARLDS